MRKELAETSEWKKVGNFAGGDIEACGNKRRLVVDDVVVTEYEIEEE